MRTEAGIVPRRCSMLYASALRAGECRPHRPAHARLAPVSGGCRLIPFACARPALRSLLTHSAHPPADCPQGRTDSRLLRSCGFHPPATSTAAIPPDIAGFPVAHRIQMARNASQRRAICFSADISACRRQIAPVLSQTRIPGFEDPPLSGRHGHPKALLSAQAPGAAGAAA
jgi:hypothetical protein